MGEFHERLGNTAKAAESRRHAAEASPAYGFPFQWEAIPVLRHAIEHDAKDARAPYYLGNLLFDWQPEEALKLWQRAATLKPPSPSFIATLLWRTHNKQPTTSSARAIAQLEQAVAAPAKYALHFTELDELYAAARTAPEKRLALLEHNQDVVSKRDDALSREIGLAIFARKYDRAIELMGGRRFSVWEGGSLDVAQHWVNAHLLRGREKLESGKFDAALSDFDQAKAIPENLPNDVDKIGASPEISYWIGVAYSRMGNNTKATESWRETAESPLAKPSGRHDASETRAQQYFIALAQQKLGRTDEADATLRSLLESAKKTLESNVAPESSSKRLRYQQPDLAIAHYLAGLGYAGLGETEEAKARFSLLCKPGPTFWGQCCISRHALAGEAPAFAPFGVQKKGCDKRIPFD